MHQVHQIPLSPQKHLRSRQRQRRSAAQQQTRDMPAAAGACCRPPCPRSTRARGCPAARGGRLWGWRWWCWLHERGALSREAQSVRHSVSAAPASATALPPSRKLRASVTPIASPFVPGENDTLSVCRGGSAAARVGVGSGLPPSGRASALSPPAHSRSLGLDISGATSECRRGGCHYAVAGSCGCAVAAELAFRCLNAFSRFSAHSRPYSALPLIPRVIMASIRVTTTTAEDKGPGRGGGGEGLRQPLLHEAPPPATAARWAAGAVQGSGKKPCWPPSSRCRC